MKKRKTGSAAAHKDGPQLYWQCSLCNQNNREQDEVCKKRNVQNASGGKCQGTKS